MDKKFLQNIILEAPYDREVWLEVLKEFFGVRKIHIKPQQIIVDKSKAEYAVELGSFTTIDEKSVGIFEVKLLPQIWIERNRVGLRSLLRQVYKYDVDGALIVFVQDDKWRFSYVSEICTEDGKKETEPKRYTYLFGKNESCRTAADRFDKLKSKPIYLNDLFEAFSVEKLNKDFFKTYKEFYEKFWKYLAGEKKYYNLLVDNRQTEEEKKQKPIRDFAKKLLGRIVFLQFLQKKGWMGVPLENLKWDGGNVKFMQFLFKNHNNKNKFHSAALKTLFFETLNTKRVNDLVPASLGSGIKIPYLNGGLFDKDISYQYDFDFPVDLFENLFDFFEQYNFTIDENDPYDNQVGIDPEMLGHIFENLLEENREKGAFYTPKEIVHYMCQESLIEYLHTQFPDDTKEDFELLVRSNQVAQSITTHKKANDINNKLKAVKICDPAIGSGAFPMGLLKEIFECRRLIYPYIKTNETFSPAIVKKEIIQQNIYGVDIENGAVEIARLRFWLALVVDETEPQPLPNLDYKIMQGNSLLERFGDINLDNLIDADDDVFVEEKRQLTFGDDFEAPVKQLTIFTKAGKEELFSLIKKYFDPDDWEKKTGEKVDKAKTKKQIDEFVEGKIHAAILKRMRNLKIDIQKLEDKWKEAGVKDFTKLNHKAKEFKKYAERKKQLDNLGDIEGKLVELQKSNDRPYFLWHLWFKDVFDKGGFDVIIGNPPYIQLQKDGGELAKILQNQGYESFEPTGDIYAVFYELGFNLLRKKGIHTFITSSQWLRANYGQSLRKYFLKKNLLTLLELGPGIFETAVVDTNILISKNEENKIELKGVVIKEAKEIHNLSNEIMQPMPYVTDEPWAILNPIKQKIKQKIADGGKPLVNWDIKINFGIKTGFNEAFIIDEVKKNELIKADSKNSEIIKPILRGREIDKYYTEWDGGYIISTFPALHVDISKYKSVKKYLKGFLPKINQTGETFINSEGFEEKTRKKTGNKWFETQDQIGYYKELSKEKIIWKRIGSILRFSYSDKEIYCLDSTCIATGEKIKYLTALLNSKLCQYQLFEISPKTGMGDLIISVQALEPLLVHYPNEKEQQTIELLLNKILVLKKSKQPTAIYENKIDALVFHLYGLTENEMLQVLDTFKDLSIKDRNQIQNEYWNIANNKFQLEV